MSMWLGLGIVVVGLSPLHGRLLEITRTVSFLIKGVPINILVERGINPLLSL